MRHALSLAALALSLVVLGTSAPVRAQKGADDETKNSAKTVKAGVLVGKVTNVEENRKIRISVSYPETTIDQGAVQQVAQAQAQVAQAQLQMRFARDPNGVFQARQQMLQAQVQLAQAQARVYRTEIRSQEIYVQGNDDLNVRASKPIPRFDDKGELKKKFTKAELKELRGNGKLPGYEADFSDVQVDQIVQVTLVRPKGVKPKAPAKGRKGKEAEDAIAEAVGDQTPQINLILILRQPITPAG